MNIEGVKYVLSAGRVFQLQTSLRDLGTQTEAFAQFFTRTQLRIPELKLPKVAEFMEKYPKLKARRWDYTSRNLISDKEEPIFGDLSDIRVSRSDTELHVAIPLGTVYPFKNRFCHWGSSLLQIQPRNEDGLINNQFVIEACLPYFWPAKTWILIMLVVSDPNGNGKNISYGLRQSHLVAIWRDDTFTYSMPNIFPSGQMCTGEVSYPSGPKLEDGIIGFLTNYLASKFNTHLLQAETARMHLRWKHDFGYVNPDPNRFDQFMVKTGNQAYDLLT